MAKFLAEHEECASDFDIRRTSGVGKGKELRVVCNGCGNRAAYDVGEPGVLKAIDPRPPKRAERGRKLTREEVERWLPAPAALPWWVPNAYIVVIIGIGLSMIAFGLVKSRDSEPVVVGERVETGADSTQAAPAPAAPQVVPPGPGAAAGAAVTGGSPAPEPELRPRPTAKAPPIDPVTVLDRFTIGVPSGWEAGTSGGAVVFRSEDDRAQVRVFLQPGDGGPRTLSRRAVDFLRGEHPEGKTTSPEDGRIGRAPTAWVESRYPGGRERAILLSEGGYEYLILARVDSSASATDRAATRAMVRSFRSL